MLSFCRIHTFRLFIHRTHTNAFTKAFINCSMPKMFVCYTYVCSKSSFKRYGSLFGKISKCDLRIGRISCTRVCISLSLTRSPPAVMNLVIGQSNEPPIVSTKFQWIKVKFQVKFIECIMHLLHIFICMK